MKYFDGVYVEKIAVSQRHFSDNLCDSNALGRKRSVAIYVSYLKLCFLKLLSAESLILNKLV